MSNFNHLSKPLFHVFSHFNITLYKLWTTFISVKFWSVNPSPISQTIYHFSFILTPIRKYNTSKYIFLRCLPIKFVIREFHCDLCIITPNISTFPMQKPIGNLSNILPSINKLNYPLTVIYRGITLSIIFIIENLWREINRIDNLFSLQTRNQSFLHFQNF